MKKIGLPSILAWSLAGIFLLGGAILLVFRLTVPSGSIDELRNTVGLTRGIRERHLVPKSRQGWITVRYGVAGAAPLETRDNVLIFSYPEIGVLETSTGFRFGLRGREYFTFGGQGLTELSMSGGTRRVWGEHDVSIGGETEEDRVERYSVFFVGTREGHERASGPLPGIPGLPGLPGLPEPSEDSAPDPG
jgi:hypothetical protein